MAKPQNGSHSVMRILSVVWFKVLPPKYGGQKGTALFNQYLAKYAELTCLCSKNNTPSEALPYRLIPELPVSKLQFLNPLCWLLVLRQVKISKPHILLLEYPYHGLAAVLAKWLYKTRLVLHEHNRESSRFKALGKWWWRALYVYERWVCRQADLVLFKTEKDRQIAITQFRLDRQKCIVVPYGVESYKPSNQAYDIRKQHGISPDEALILFAGTLDYEPNAAAVVNIYQHLVPALECKTKLFKILICGRLKVKKFQYLKTAQHPNVLFVGEVETIEPYLDAANVFINPVLYSGGIQTKIIDALNHQCAVVAFEKALEGFKIETAGTKLIVVEDENWKDFAGAIQKSFSKGSVIPEEFYLTYNWNVIIERFLTKLKLFQNPIQLR